MRDQGFDSGRRPIWTSIACLMTALLSAQTESPARAAAVYECTADGRHIFSDQPCGSDARQREISEPNGMKAPESHRPRPATRKPVQRRQQNDADDRRKRAACNRNREQMESIRARMRLGYTAAQGIRYEERLRKLRDQYREQRCDRYR